MSSFSKKIRFIGILSVLLAFLMMSSTGVQKELGLTSVAKAAGSGGGPIVLDGMDPVCHSGGEGTWGYIGQVLKKVYDGSSIPNNAKIAILGSRDTTNSCGGNWNTLMTTKYLNQFSTAPSFEFLTTDSSINSFFSSLGSSASSTPRMIWIPDNWARAASTEAIFTSNAEKIADFVNSGGGLFANMGSYGWLTALLPGAVFNNGGCNGGPDATADGAADFGLTNAMVAACWHGYFTGNVGTLKTLVDYPFPTGSTRKAVSIGGGSVSLPSSFTLAISPTNPSAGTPLTITATAQTLAGVPQAGVVVSMTVSSGPDAGQTFTATTNASGIATITVNTSSVGTNVYTATATVNGVAKTVSTTVTWIPAPTTTAPATTTTEAPVPETTLAPTTTLDTTPPTTQAPEPPQTSVNPTTSSTSELPVTALAPTTTVHDHSSHSHGPLPSTGSRAQDMFAAGLLTFGLGLLLMAARFRKQEVRRTK